MKQDIKTKKSLHIPVLPKEVISFLNIKPDGVYIDGTCGLGGHSKLISENLSEDGVLIAIDLDQSAIKESQLNLKNEISNIFFENNSYSNLPEILTKLSINSVDGILLDLGLSSLQLDSLDRGFSYLTNSNLDMRFNQNSHINAEKLINNISEKDLADIIYKYGEERKSRKIAKRICQLRPLKNVQDLVWAIKKTTPPRFRNKTLSRVFQAIRIAVNDELEKLSEFLDIFTNYLKVGGRIVIISFHSIEDRMVKRCFKKNSLSGILKIITKKPQTPSNIEIEFNNRSRSAKLRCAEKIYED